MDMSALSRLKSAKFLKVWEALCIIILAVFISLTVGSTRTSDASAKEVCDKVLQAAGIDSLTLRKNDSFKKSFGLDAKSFDEVVYYSSDDIMTVDEILVVKLKEGVSADSLMSSVTGYAQDRFNIYNGYAQAQSELLANYVLKHSGNFVLFAVCSDAHLAQDEFIKALK